MFLAFDFYKQLFLCHLNLFLSAKTSDYKISNPDCEKFHQISEDFQLILLNLKELYDRNKDNSTLKMRGKSIIYSVAIDKENILKMSNEELKKVVDEKYNLIEKIESKINESDPFDVLLFFYKKYFDAEETQELHFLKTEMNVLIELNNERNSLRINFNNNDIKNIFKNEFFSVSEVLGIIKTVEEILLIYEKYEFTSNQMKELLTDESLNIFMKKVKQWNLPEFKN